MEVQACSLDMRESIGFILVCYAAFLSLWFSFGSLFVCCMLISTAVTVIYGVGG